ncbi:hypothetical protein SDC9_138895 [bioreactor metagenome]|uniref:Uncharacterized protein n=1 Tax=bioreactor metagenome TaxID=1076179 RepID=A0A645DR33_9ZZZZ
MRDGRHVLDEVHIQPCGLQGADGRFTAGTGAFYVHFNGLEAMLHRAAGGGFRCHLGCERSGLLGSAEPERTCARPADGVALQVGDGHKGVVEGGTDVRCAALNIFALAAFPRGSGLLYLFRCCHFRLSSLLSLAALRALRAFASSRVLLGALSANGQAFAVTHAAVTADLDQPLDVHRSFTAKVAFHFDVVVNVISQLGNVAFGQVAHADVGVDAGCGQYFRSGFAADPKDVGQTDFNPFVPGKVYARNTCHIVPLPP